MAKKTTTTPTDASKSPAPDDVVHSELTGAVSSPSGDAGNNSTDTPESDANSGAGNSASPAGLAEAIIQVLVDEAGCADPQHLVAMAKLGLSVWDFLGEAALRDGPLKDWPVHDDPSQMVPYLFELALSLESKLAFRDAPDAAEGKRGFIALKQVRLDNELTEMLKPIWLTETQHGELAAAGSVDPDWDKGVKA